MADVTPILINQLTSQTTLQDTDYFIVGGDDAKKITVAQMKEALGINSLNTNMRYLKKIDYSPISLQANVTKSVTVPVSGLSGKIIDGAIVTLRGGIPYMASINSIDSNAIEISLKADSNMSNRMIEVYVFYH